MDDFNIQFDPGSLAELTKLEGMAALLNPDVQKALTQAGELITTTTQTNTWGVFDNPTGVLASSIYFWVASPSQVEVAVGVPYGRRRELGGGGLRDSLGRPMNDRARPYMQPAVDTDAPMIQMMVKETVLNSFGGVL
jgi:hypothetical protein